MGRKGQRITPPGQERLQVDPDPPEVKRVRPTISRTFVPLAVKHGGVTIAQVCAATGCTMREGIGFLRALEADRKAIRYGGEPGKPFVWMLPRADG